MGFRVGKITVFRESGGLSFGLVRGWFRLKFPVLMCLLLCRFGVFAAEFEGFGDFGCFRRLRAYKG